MILMGYFNFYPADRNLILLAAGMIIGFIISLFILNYILKKREITGKKAAIIKLIINMVFFLAFFGIMEYRAGCIEEEISRTHSHTHTMDLLLHIAHKKNEKDRWWVCHSYSTNSHGLRSSVEIPFKKAKNEYRILLLGDSWSFGIGVNDNQTFSHLLQVNLQKKYPDKKITVINAGCPGYCLAQDFIYLKFRGIKYDPDMVIVNNSLNYVSLQAFMKIYPLPSSRLVKSIKSVLWRSNLYLFVKRMLFIQKSRKIINKMIPPDIELLEDYTYKLLWEFDRYCKRRGIKILYLHLYFDEGNFFGGAMDDFVWVNKSCYVKVPLDRKRDAEFHRKYDFFHPGPNNVKIIAEKLTEYILERKLAESKTGKH